MVSLNRSEVSLASDLRNVIPLRKFVPFCTENREQCAAIAQYPLASIRYALHEFVGEGLQFNALSKSSPDILLNSGIIPSIQGQLPPPIPFYVHNLFAEPTTLPSEDALNIGANGEAYRHGMKDNPQSFPLQIFSNTRKEGLYLPELERVGAENSKVSVIKTTISRPLYFKVSPWIVFDLNSIWFEELTPDYMAEKGLKGLEQLIMSLQSATKHGIVYFPKYSDAFSQPRIKL